MNPKITLNGIEYELDVQKAEARGYLKKVSQSIIKINPGDVFSVSGWASLSSTTLLLLCNYERTQWFLLGNGLQNYCSGQGMSFQATINYLNKCGYQFVKNINDEVAKLMA